MLLLLFFFFFFQKLCLKLLGMELLGTTFYSSSNSRGVKYVLIVVAVT